MSAGSLFQELQRATLSSTLRSSSLQIPKDCHRSQRSVGVKTVCYEVRLSARGRTPDERFFAYLVCKSLQI